MKASTIVLAVLSATISHASPLIFQFSTTLDATEVGGGAATPLVVTYTFDSDLADGTGPFGLGGSYGPLTMKIQVGDQIVSASGGGITVFDDAGTSIVEDSYDVRPDQTGFSGKLFGRDIRYFRFLLVDQERNMFSSTALPLLPDFASAADYQQITLDLADGIYLGFSEGPETPPGERTPFTLTIIPEPSTVTLLALGGFAITARLRRTRQRL